VLDLALLGGPQLKASGLSASYTFTPLRAIAPTAANGRSEGEMVNSVRYVLAIALLLFAIYVVVFNWCCVIISIRNKRRGIDRHFSTIPIVISIVFTVLAYGLYPGAAKLWMLSIPLLDFLALMPNHSWRGP
jgi:hypothetical protein